MPPALVAKSRTPTCTMSTAIRWCSVAAPATSALGAGFVPVRTRDNTLDLRGHRVEESLDLVDAFLDRLLDRGEPVGYVLHGHGTGALKVAVRAHLGSSPYVRRSHPAEPDDGGDAFTVAWLCE